MFLKEIMQLLLDKTSSRNDIISRNKYISTVKQFLKAPKRNLQALLIPTVKEVANFIYCWQLFVAVFFCAAVFFYVFICKLVKRKNCRKACERSLDLNARRTLCKCLWIAWLHVFFRGCRRACVNKSGRLVKICFLLGKINIHRFLLLIGVSLENVSIMNEDYWTCRGRRERRSLFFLFFCFKMCKVEVETAVYSLCFCFALNMIGVVGFLPAGRDKGFSNRKVFLNIGVWKLTWSLRGLFCPHPHKDVSAAAVKKLN